MGYRTYDGETTVEPFSVSTLQKYKGEIQRVVNALSGASASDTPASERQRVEFDLSVGKERESARVVIPALRDGAVIRELVLRPSSIEPDALRSAIISFRFDGEETALAPLGDFFGSAPGVNPYDSLPLTVSKDGTFTCRWPMPFRKEAVVELRTTSNRASHFAGHVVTGPYSWDDRSLLFNAGWRAHGSLSTAPPRDWNYVEIEGRGIYTGNVLSVANPVKAWWGEGDEKIYVDGEAFPSHFGTGTEDYYGYAWCSPELFTRPFHNQTRCDGPGNFGYTSVNRWHVLDAIPFGEQFRFDMEVWHWNREVEVGYAAVSYWYARPGSTSNTRTIDKETLMIPPLPERKVKVIAGAIEGESLKVLEVDGTAEPQDLAGFEPELWSKDRHLWWREAKPGGRLRLAFPAPADGRYKVVAYLTKAKDYGVHRILINGKAAGDPIDFYDERVVPVAPLDLGIVALRASGNELTVECVGTNDKANPRNYMFGLDCIVLAAVAEPAVSDSPRERRLPVREYVDRMKAGWIGQMVGRGLGRDRPSSITLGEDHAQRKRSRSGNPEMVNQFEQDDLYVEMTFLRTLEQSTDSMRPSATRQGIDFANSGYPLWHANSGGPGQCFVEGIAPPDSGHPALQRARRRYRLPDRGGLLRSHRTGAAGHGDRARGDLWSFDEPRRRRLRRPVCRRHVRCGLLRRRPRAPGRGGARLHSPHESVRGDDPRCPRLVP